jgi:hypothetical protein
MEPGLPPRFPLALLRSGAFLEWHIGMRGFAQVFSCITTICGDTPVLKENKQACRLSGRQKSKYLLLKMYFMIKFSSFKLI